jgi:hypothetical protein
MSTPNSFAVTTKTNGSTAQRTNLGASQKASCPTCPQDLKQCAIFPIMPSLQVGKPLTPALLPQSDRTKLKQNASVSRSAATSSTIPTRSALPPLTSPPSKCSSTVSSPRLERVSPPSTSKTSTWAPPWQEKNICESPSIPFRSQSLTSTTYLILFTMVLSSSKSAVTCTVYPRPAY